MLENLSFFINASDYFRLSLERNEFGVEAQLEVIVNDNEIQEQFYATDIYDLFCQLSVYADQDLDYKFFKRNYYSLWTIDKMELVNDGLCYAVSKAKRLVYKERYDTHPNLESYFNELQTQITSIQDYNKPIYDISSCQNI